MNLAAAGVGVFCCMPDERYPCSWVRYVVVAVVAVAVVAAAGFDRKGWTDYTVMSGQVLLCFLDWKNQSTGHFLARMGPRIH